MMEYLEGVKKAKTLEIGELLVQAEGTEVKVNGAVHTIRDMGNVAFVILRKRDGLVQCVFEEGVTAFDLKELKEASAVEVLGTIRNPYDLEPEEEHLIGELFKEDYGADFVFITHYPSKKRPFYAMDDPQDARFTLSFDLLFRGLEITTGGQRIHSYQQLLDKIEAKKMTTEGLEQYLDTFRHGMPPHGGLGIGLERLTMQLISEDNVRETTLFPRDLSRLEP